MTFVRTQVDPFQESAAARPKPPLALKRTPTAMHWLVVGHDTP